MTELVNSGGLRIKFDPKSDSAVTDHDEAGQPQTCVYGILKTPQKIGGTVDAFLSLIGLKAKFVHFNRPNGTSVWINVDAVDSLIQSNPADHPGSHAVINAGDLSQAVRETIDAAATALNAHGGKF